MRKPKWSNVLRQRKNFVKSVRKQYRNPDSHPFSFCKNCNTFFLSMYVCMYTILTPRKVATFFERFSPFYTHYTLLVHPYQPLSTGSGSILGAGARRSSPGISIARTAIVVVGTPYIWSYVSVLYFTGKTSVSRIELEACFQSFGHHLQALAHFFWTYSFRWVPNH